MIESAGARRRLAPRDEGVRFHDALGAELAEQGVVELGGAGEVVGSQGHVTDHPLSSLWNRSSLLHQHALPGRRSPCQPSSLPSPDRLTTEGRRALRYLTVCQRRDAALHHASPPLPPPRPARAGTALGARSRRRQACSATTAWPSLTMASIAEKAGCSRPAVYQYFTNKEEVVAALAIESAALRNRLYQRVPSFDARPRERLVALAEVDAILYPDWPVLEETTYANALRGRTSAGAPQRATASAARRLRELPPLRDRGHRGGRPRAAAAGDDRSPDLHAGDLLHRPLRAHLARSARSRRSGVPTRARRCGGWGRRSSTASAGGRSLPSGTIARRCTGSTPRSSRPTSSPSSVSRAHVRSTRLARRRVAARAADQLRSHSHEVSTH